MLPPLPALPGENLPPEEPPLGEKLGAGVLLPEPAELLLVPEPVFDPATGPADGPATFGAATFGIGTLKLLLGLFTLGALGFIAGLGATVGAFV